MNWQWPQKDGKAADLSRARPREPILTKRGRVFVFVLAITFPGLYALGIYNERSRTPEQRAADAEMSAIRQRVRADEARATRAAVEQRNRELEVMCPIAPTCEKWAKSRQECATAGDFENCMRIKMDSDYAVAGLRCSTSGVPDVIGWRPPATGECMMWKLGLK